MLSLMQCSLKKNSQSNVVNFRNIELLNFNRLFIVDIMLNWSHVIDYE